jgi:hypothetical protein
VCRVPKRRWRRLLRPVPLVVSAAALAVVFAGWALPSPLGSVLMVIGCLALFLFVFLPALWEIEFGFPAHMKPSTALEEREEELLLAFESQKEELEICAHLLNSDPSQASELLEAAWTRTAATWRGRVTPDVRIYTLCVFYQLLGTHSQKGTRTGKLTEGQAKEFFDLPPADDRAIVVLHEFANLSAPQIARIVGSSRAQVETALDRINNRLGRAGTTESRS